MLKPAVLQGLIDKNEITKSNSVKYLGVWFDDKLNWSAHIQDLFLQLAKCSNMLVVYIEVNVAD